MLILRMLQILFAMKWKSGNIMVLQSMRFDVDKSTRSLKIMASKANDPNSYVLKCIYYENKSSLGLRKIVATVIGRCDFNFIYLKF